MPGFPDSEKKLDNIVRAYAKIASTEPYQLPALNHLRPYMSDEDIARELAPSKWKEGVIPAEWLIDQIRNSCKFFPAPIEARVIYCRAGWNTVDGQDASIAEDLPREVFTE